MLDRKTAPNIKPIESIKYILPEKWQLDNGVPVWGINAGSQELVKIDFIFEAGTWYQKQNLVAGLANSLMNQGTENYNAQQIAEIFDFRGAYLQLIADQQNGTVTILTLNKYLDEILAVTADIIHRPVYPEKEVNMQLGKKRQQFIIENNKVKVLAQKRFSQVVFGEKHPYANTNIITDYDLLSAETLRSFHRQYYTMNNCKILVAGQYDDHLKQLLNKHFGSVQHKSEAEPKRRDFKIINPEKRQHHVLKEDAVQSAIRLGRIFPNRNDTDFFGLNFLITLLGGYFGSRLMTNIREEKGYTYGIGAGIFTLPNAAFVSIMTEVGAEVCEPALHEIYKEMERLQQEKVGEEEMEIVRNYLLGETLRSFDGIFSMSNSLKTLVEMNLEYDHYDRFVEMIQTITTDELLRLARQYLQKDEMLEVVAGKAF